ncbi:hypothetical protein PsYK624_112680 [Phanerochaete sordida]|uniref:Uncharacterized protein n=1 Tax=Phanerochaete sordida TaxID=48140 RepID=A0A9P3GFJ9_9APHY|nr:hypothetical protein PsYK624_112680 [Phanerochaete sordida]
MFLYYVQLFQICNIIVLTFCLPWNHAQAWRPGSSVLPFVRGLPAMPMATNGLSGLPVENHVVTTLRFDPAAWPVYKRHLPMKDERKKT